MRNWNRLCVISLGAPGRLPVRLANPGTGRTLAVEIGRRLGDRGVLAHATDAVFLEEPELRAALSRADREDLRGLVARLRQKGHG
jgi:hypothetical protein